MILKKISSIVLLVLCFGFASCIKESIKPSSNDDTLENTIQTRDAEESSPYVEEWISLINELPEDQAMITNTAEGFLDVTYIDILPDPDPIPFKKFKNNKLGGVSAAKYANKLMDAGKCVKSWKKDGYIHVVVIPC